MSFDKATRNALAKMVGQVRERLKSDVMDQLRRLGFQADGTVLDLNAIAGLSESEREAGQELRDQLAHFISLEDGAGAVRRQAAYERMAREIGFTTVNRLVALRMAEERGLIVESVAKGLASAGFQIYERVARDALGTRAETYRAYLECLYDELVLDLPALFDRLTPESRIFPGERALEEVLTLLNDPVLAHLWKEDEAIGWVYQYYNDPAERKRMRDASQAPRNSRELAVRNQFFTPRYVVEFLTDNTLGRIWYETRRGGTRMADDCRYLVRRKHPIWLEVGHLELRPFDPRSHNGGSGGASERDMWTRPNTTLVDWTAIAAYALTVDGYTYAQEHDLGDIGDLANSRLAEYRETGTWRGSFEELRLCLFFEQRRWRHFGETPSGNGLTTTQALHTAICDAWDREADVIAYRAKKDPRDLKILDPACGSGHFLLYSFDLMATIYEEAWEDDRGPTSEVTGKRLCDDYSDLSALRRDVPGLILRYNLHGVDIDPRACQIAALALWLRAQRAYLELRLKPAERPQITKSHIVCAEPMPGEQGMLDEYLKRHVDPRLHELVRVIWAKMQLAGEAGTLLRIEEEIAEELRAARERAQVDVPPVQVSLFQKGEPVVQQRMTFSTAEDRAFWAEAERKLLAALRDYASQATNGHATQRRLFAEDVEQGFAFIDLCRQRFDVVLMNPPFGLGIPRHFASLDKSYPDTYVDMYASFVARGLELAIHGRVGAITSRAFLTTKKLERWRRNSLISRCEVLADLGAGVMDDARVEACAYTVTGVPSTSPTFEAMNARLLESKSDNILRFAQNPGQLAYVPHRRRLLTLPGAKILYALPEKVSELLEQSARFEPEVGTARQGMTTFDDPRFLRLRWEVPAFAIGRDHLWEPLAKGGEFAHYYSDIHLLVKWCGNGAELAEVNREVNGQVAQSRQASSYFHRPGATYSKRSAKGFSARALPAGCIFGTKGPVVLSESSVMPSYIVGWLNSRLIRSLIHMQANFSEFNTGIIKALPWCLPSNYDELVCWADSMIDAGRDAGRLSETDAYFCGWLTGGTLRDMLDGVATRRSNCASVISSLAVRFDQAIDMAYQVSGSDVEAAISGEEEDGLQESDEDDIIESSGSDSGTRADVHAFLSQVVGIIFGRWDLRIVSGSVRVPLPHIFDDLPVVSPASLVDPEGLPATPGGVVSVDWLCARPDAISLPPGETVRQPTIPDNEYPIRIAWDGILVDDPEHPADIVRHVREVLAVLWPAENGAQAEAIEREACGIMGLRELREYFRQPQGLFEDHLKRYSKSRRQAPIYWPLSTASGSYTLWIYYHRLTSDTLYTAVNRYVDPKIAEVRRRVDEDMRTMEGASGRDASRLRVSVEQGQAFLRELHDFREELLRVAAQPYRPNLNDGVIITAAPLHRLFRLPRWEKDAKACWETLERGENDWAHLAYTLWPDRVREKCRSDKSLAIAHGLEELYIEPPATAKKARGRKASALVEAEVLDLEDSEE
jgi:Eco57I restriction-modification methylase